MAPIPSRKTIAVGGIAVSVYSLPEVTEPSAPVSVLFFLHGRTQKASDYEWVAHSTLEMTDELRKEAGEQGQDLLVVLLVSRSQTIATRASRTSLTNREIIGSAESR